MLVRGVVVLLPPCSRQAFTRDLSRCEIDWCSLHPSPVVIVILLLLLLLLLLFDDVPRWSSQHCNIDQLSPWGRATRVEIVPCVLCHFFLYVRLSRGKSIPVSLLLLRRGEITLQLSHRFLEDRPGLAWVWILLVWGVRVGMQRTLKKPDTRSKWLDIAPRHRIQRCSESCRCLARWLGQDTRIASTHCVGMSMSLWWCIAHDSQLHLLACLQRRCLLLSVAGGHYVVGRAVHIDEMYWYGRGRRRIHQAHRLGWLRLAQCDKARHCSTGHQQTIAVST